MKIKNNVKHFNVIYVLVVFLFFALMPITISSTAEGEYQISDEQTLKNWLQDSGSVQTNNPNAVLTTDITLNWGGVAPDGVGQGSSAVNSGSTLDGQGHNVIIQGGSHVTSENGRGWGNLTSTNNSPYYVGMFVQYIYGTIKGINFSFASDKTVTIAYYKNKDNEQIFTGMIAGSIENGRVENCSLTIDKNITYNERNAYNIINDAEISGSGSNHSGGIAGRMVGSTVIKDVKIVQSSGTITVHTNHGGSNFNRFAFVASDSYRNDAGVPQVINVQIERYGNITIRDNSDLTSKGNYLYGIVIADMSTSSENDANHAVHINGVIYNGVADVAWGANDQIDFGNYGGPDGFSYNYFTGRYPNGSTIHNEPDIFSIQNVYSYATLTSESSLQNEVGVSLIPSGYTASFNANSEGQMIFTKNNAGTNDFIYSISQTESATTFNTYLQLSSSVTLDKFNTAASVGMDTISILDGTKVDNASFGFQYSEVIYNGFAYGAIFKVNDQIVTDGFTVSYTNNVNSTITNGGQKATCSLDHPDIESGIFLHSTRYYVDNNKIDYLNLEMTINQAPLTLTYTGSNVYDNNLAINGLVNDQEKLTIDGNTYTNGNYQFDCVNNNTLKTIEFIDNIIKTNYLISYEGIENDQFTVNPKVITVDQGITITNANDPSKVVFEDNMLTIYSKDYQTIQLNFNQNEGYLNQVTIETTNETNYKIENSISGTTLTYNITPKVNNDFKYIEKLTLVETLTKVALKFEVNDKSLLSTLKVNNENVYKFGQYFVYDCNYNEQAVISLSLIDSEEQYNIEVLVNGEPISAIEGNYSITVKGDENYIMNIIINITTV